MINYESFKKEVRKKILGCLPKEFSGTVKVEKIQKINQEKEALIILREECSYPILYFYDLYEEYLQSRDLDKVLSNASASIKRLGSRLNSSMNSLDQMKVENIICFLVKTEKLYKAKRNIYASSTNWCNSSCLGA